ncbi:HypC/HybG/HupF family hydrogenase formation chaperone [bacterium]|nr:HypC/HybG/HupF family hydrogenase formation chaperone [bacterium]
MCLAFPAKVLRREGDTGSVEINGVIKDVNFFLLPEAKVGDFVLVHTGIAISIVEQSEAEQTLSLIDEMERMMLEEFTPPRRREGD